MTTQYLPPVLLVTLAAGLLSACGASQPLRIADDEGARISDQEPLPTDAKPAQLSREKAPTRTEAKAQARRLEAEAEARQPQVLEDRRQHAGVGDLIQCILEPVDIRYRKTWKATHPISFDLIRGEIRPLAFRARAGNTHTTGWARFQGSGPTVSLCRNHSDSSGLSDCADLSGTTKEFRRGVNRPIEIKGFLKGRLRCDLKPMKWSG